MKEEPAGGIVFPEGDEKMGSKGEAQLPAAPDIDGGRVGGGGVAITCALPRVFVPELAAENADKDRCVREWKND